MTIVCQDDIDAPSDVGIIQPWNGRLDRAPWWHFADYATFSMSRHVLGLREWKEALEVL